MILVTKPFSGSGKTYSSSGVVLACGPFVLGAWHLSLLSFLSLFVVVFGAASLQTRWLTWSSSQEVNERDGISEEVPS